MKLLKPKGSTLPSSLFHVPIDYFDDLNARTMLIVTNSNKTSSIFGDYQTFLFRVAAVLILALSIPLVNQINKKPIDSEEIERYISLSNVDDMELATLLTASDLEDFNTNIKIDDSVIEDILLSNSNFETYITN